MSADEVTVDVVHVGWRSLKTGNLFRHGPNSAKDWAADGYEPVFVRRPVRFNEPWICAWCHETHRPMDACRVSANEETARSALRQARSEK